MVLWYDIDGLNFNMISSRACLVLDDTVCLSSNSAIQSENISRSSPHTVYSMSNNPDAITTDTIESHYGTLLTRVNRSVGHAVAKLSKYVYRLVVANNSYLNVYEM